MRLKLFAILMTLGLLAACGGSQPPAEQPATDQPVTDQPEPAAPADTAPVDGWTATPSLDLIPVGPIKGLANGRPFEAKAVYFEPSFGKWRLVIGDKPLETPTDIVMDSQSINIDMPEMPVAGKSWTRELKYGDGYFQIAKTDAPAETTSWNADNAWVVEISSWDIKPYDPQGQLFQQGGTASGRVYVCYKGSGDIRDSWAAGTFENVPVRYMGQPDIKY